MLLPFILISFLPNVQTSFLTYFHCVLYIDISSHIAFDSLLAKNSVVNSEISPDIHVDTNWHTYIVLSHSSLEQLLAHIRNVCYSDILTLTQYDFGVDLTVDKFWHKFYFRSSAPHPICLETWHKDLKTFTWHHLTGVNKCIDIK